MIVFFFFTYNIFIWKMKTLVTDLMQCKLPGLMINEVSVRGVWRKLRLDPGQYVIVASTHKPDQSGEFFVRIFSKTGNTLG